jgi:hypothetical protein
VAEVYRLAALRWVGAMPVDQHLRGAEDVGVGDQSAAVRFCFCRRASRPFSNVHYRQFF